MPNVNDIVIEEQIVNAIRPLTDKEHESLRQAIVADGAIHDPILWCRLDDHSEVLCDGYHRLHIFEELRESGTQIDEPTFHEVVCLRGKPVEDVVAWVRHHQASRRNDETLADLYRIGLQRQEKPSSQVAEDTGKTPQQVRHLAKMAENIDKAEEIEPGSREAILSSDLKPTVIRDSNPEELTKTAVESRSARAGAQKEKSGLQAFEPVTKQLASIQKSTGILSRAIQAIANEDTPTSWSEQCEKLINEIATSTEAMVDQVKEWMRSKA